MELVGYVRVSSDSQVDGFGLAVQRQQIEQWARRNKHAIAYWCEDAGVSGTTDAVDRPGLSCAFAALADGEADGLVVARLDRLARALTVSEAILAALWRDNYRVFSADSGEIQQDDPDDPLRTALRQVVAVFAELDRRMLIKRMRDGKRAKVAAGGKGSGSYPYGYSKTGPIDAEQAVLADIRELRAKGSTWQQIADALNGQGIEPRSAARWSSQTVRKVCADSPRH